MKKVKKNCILNLQSFHFALNVIIYKQRSEIDGVRLHYILLDLKTDIL